MNELQEVRTLEIVAAEIRSYTWSMLTNIIEIGRRLCEAKEMLPHGEFMNWCTENFGYSKSQTNNFMRLYEAYGSEQNSMFGAELNRQTFGTLNYSKALALLALPSAEEREAFIEENNVDEMTTRELQQAIREKQEAEKKIEALQKDIEGERNRGDDAIKAKMEAEDLLKTQDQMLAEAKAQIAELAKLNKELENRPHEVAVETVRDEEAIAAAAKEAKEKAEEAAKKRIAALEKQLNKAENERAEAVKKAETAGQDTEKQLKAAAAEAEKIRAELEEARKQLKASDSDVTAFGIRFNSMQSEFGYLIAEYRKVEARDPETADKLHEAVRQLLEYFQRELDRKEDGQSV